MSLYRKGGQGVGRAECRRMTRIHLSPDPGADGSPNVPEVEPPGASPAAAPPAAAAVMESDVIESDAGELVKTKRQLAEERAARKAEQVRLSELEDENRRLKSAGLAPVPPPSLDAARKKSWLAGFLPVIGSEDDDT